MLVGAAVVPASPLLVRGVSAALPAPVATVRRHAVAALASLPAADVAVLLVADERQGVHDVAAVSLAGVGLPDVSRGVRVCRTALSRVSAATQYPLLQGDGLPVDLAVLALLLPDEIPVCPVAVPPGATFQALTAVGSAVAGALADAGIRAAVVAAGDLSAALSEHSPRYAVSGAPAWDDRVVAELDTGRLHGLGRLGPAAALSVHARGWAPIAVLHGALERARVGLVLRHYSAPRGVGYVVAQGA